MAGYKFWKFEFYEAQVPTKQYVIINELYFFSTSTGVIGTDEISKAGAVATSKGFYQAGTTEPKFAIDGNKDTYYESESSPFSSGSTTWLKIQFPSPINPKKLIIDSTQYPGEQQKRFAIFVSNDDITYKRYIEISRDLFVKVGDRTIAEIPLNRFISGELTSEDGVVPGLEALCFLWNEPYSYITKTTPDANGDYRIGVLDDLEYMIVHRGANGLKPQIDGPIRPKEE